MWEALLQLGASFLTFAGNLATVLALVGRFLLPYLPVLLWCAWWLWCANWKKIWPALARGAWVPVVLLILVSALAWSRIFPDSYAGLPNFWWQLVACSLLALIALFCGFLQGQFAWTPAEVSFDPPAAEGGHHGHH